MIPIPVRWSAEQRGDAVLLVHPDGFTAGSITYRDRLRPLRRVGALVRTTLATIPRFRADRVDVPERLVTNEGEYATLVTVNGRAGEEHEQLDLGFVFADDYYASVTSSCRVHAHMGRATDLVRDLVLRDSQALGVRRRRFEYAPPDGWQPVRRALATAWIPPDYPNDTTWLMVYAANPIAVVPDIGALAGELELLGYQIDGHTAIECVENATLSGKAQRFQARTPSGRAFTREVVVLRDGRYAYVIELSSHTPATWSRAEDAMRLLLASVRPVPEPHGPPASMFAHWIE